MFAIIDRGQVWDLLPESMDIPGFDVVDVSDVEGIALGWLAKDDGTFSPPPSPQPNSFRLVTYKADLWRRATEDEAEKMDEALNALPIRLRRMYADSQHIDHSDEYFPALSEGLIALFGEPRASELLAVSD